MKRTQLYLDDDLWQALHLKARETGSTLSELVRQAARERYLPSPDARRKAFLDFVGIRKDLPVTEDSTAYIRRLRRDTRRKRLNLP